MFAHQAIGLGRRGVLRQAGRNDRGFGFRAKRKITLVADADNFFVQAQSKQNLRSGRQQGNDAHIANFSTLRTAWEFTARCQRRGLSVEEVVAADGVVSGEVLGPTREEFLYPWSRRQMLDGGFGAAQRRQLADQGMVWVVSGQ